MLLMLFVLPFQLVWGAAAPYCAHEASVSVNPHFGHHEHQHGADAPGDHDRDHDGDADRDADPDGGRGDSAGKSPGVSDLDCGLCHGACSGLPAAGNKLAATGAAAPPLTRPQAGLPTAPHRPPERPQWLRLA